MGGYVASSDASSAEAPRRMSTTNTEPVATKWTYGRPVTQPQRLPLTHAAQLEYITAPSQSADPRTGKPVSATWMAATSTPIAMATRLSTVPALA